ncbi:MAG: pilus assembly protein [Candidatus Latescibacterota bacterium]|nr:MAG: pilus assembly protein [Candidatus Latescibacterota bacterium]
MNFARQVPGLNQRGNAFIEFTVLLPLLLLLLVGLVDLCMLLDEQLTLVHLGREAASVFSRGAGFEETFAAITNADGALQLDGDAGRIILTRIALDNRGRPVITAQRSIGSLTRPSRVGTLPAGAATAPATIPNGRDLHPGMSIAVVELFSAQRFLLSNAEIAPGEGTIVLRSLAAF